MKQILVSLENLSKLCYSELIYTYFPVIYIILPEYQLSAKSSPKYQLTHKNLAKYRLSVKIRDYQLPLEGIEEKEEKKIRFVALASVPREKTVRSGNPSRSREKPS